MLFGKDFKINFQRDTRAVYSANVGYAGESPGAATVEIEMTCYAPSVSEAQTVQSVAMSGRGFTVVPENFAPGGAADSFQYDGATYTVQDFERLLADIRRLTLEKDSLKAEVRRLKQLDRPIGVALNSGNVGDLVMVRIGSNRIGSGNAIAYKASDRILAASEVYIDMPTGSVSMTPFPGSVKMSTDNSGRLQFGNSDYPKVNPDPNVGAVDSRGRVLPIYPCYGVVERGGGIGYTVVVKVPVSQADLTKRGSDEYWSVDATAEEVLVPGDRVQLGKPSSSGQVTALKITDGIPKKDGRFGGLEFDDE